MIDERARDYHPVEFLIVDDDEISVTAIRRALKKLGVVNPTSVAGDGVEALARLDAVIAENGGRLPPVIVTLDVNMPRMGGLEFLERVRSDPRLRKLVVFVVTTSDAPGDLSFAHERNVTGYIVKENPVGSLQAALAMVRDYSNLVVLPR